MSQEARRGMRAGEESQDIHDDNRQMAEENEAMFECEPFFGKNSIFRLIWPDIFGNRTRGNPVLLPSSAAGAIFSVLFFGLAAVMLCVSIWQLAQGSFREANQDRAILNSIFQLPTGIKFRDVLVPSLSLFVDMQLHVYSSLDREHDIKHINTFEMLRGGEISEEDPEFHFHPSSVSKSIVASSESWEPGAGSDSPRPASMVSLSSEQFRDELDAAAANGKLTRTQVSVESLTPGFSSHAYALFRFQGRQLESIPSCSLQPVIFSGVKRAVASAHHPEDGQYEPKPGPEGHAAVIKALSTLQPDCRSAVAAEEIVHKFTHEIDDDISIWSPNATEKIQTIIQTICGSSNLESPMRIVETLRDSILDGAETWLPSLRNKGQAINTVELFDDVGKNDMFFPGGSALSVGSEDWVAAINFVYNFNHTVIHSECPSVIGFAAQAVRVSSWAGINSTHINVTLNSLTPSADPVDYLRIFNKGRHGFISLVSEEGIEQFQVVGASEKPGNLASPWSVNVILRTVDTSLVTKSPLRLRLGIAEASTTPPQEWICPRGMYGDGKCDCSCGAVDLDCPTGGTSFSGCSSSKNWCNSHGQCSSHLQAPDVFASSMCDQPLYMRGDHRLRGFSGSLNYWNERSQGQCKQCLGQQEYNSAPVWMGPPGQGGLYCFPSVQAATSNGYAIGHEINSSAQNSSNGGVTYNLIFAGWFNLGSGAFLDDIGHSSFNRSMFSPFNFTMAKCRSSQRLDLRVGGVTVASGGCTVSSTFPSLGKMQHAIIKFSNQLSQGQHYLTCSPSDFSSLPSLLHPHTTEGNQVAKCMSPQLLSSTSPALQTAIIALPSSMSPFSFRSNMKAVLGGSVVSVQAVGAVKARTTSIGQIFLQRVKLGGPVSLIGHSGSLLQNVVAGQQSIMVDPSLVIYLQNTYFTNCSLASNGTSSTAGCPTVLFTIEFGDQIEVGSISRVLASSQSADPIFLDAALSVSFPKFSVIHISKPTPDAWNRRRVAADSVHTFSLSVLAELTSHQTGTRFKLQESGKTQLSESNSGDEQHAQSQTDIDVNVGIFVDRHAEEREESTFNQTKLCPTIGAPAVNEAQSIRNDRRAKVLGCAGWEYSDGVGSSTQRTRDEAGGLDPTWVHQINVEMPINNQRSAQSIPEGLTSKSTDAQMGYMFVFETLSTTQRSDEESKVLSNSAGFNTASGGGGTSVTAGKAVDSRNRGTASLQFGAKDPGEDITPRNSSVKHIKLSVPHPDASLMLNIKSSSWAKDDIDAAIQADQSKAWKYATDVKSKLANMHTKNLAVKFSSTSNDGRLVLKPGIEYIVTVGMSVHPVAREVVNWVAHPFVTDMQVDASILSVTSIKNTKHDDQCRVTIKLENDVSSRLIMQLSLYPWWSFMADVGAASLWVLIGLLLLRGWVWGSRLFSAVPLPRDSKKALFWMRKTGERAGMAKKNQ